MFLLQWWKTLWWLDSKWRQWYWECTDFKIVPDCIWSKPHSFYFLFTTIQDNPTNPAPTTDWIPDSQTLKMRRSMTRLQAYISPIIFFPFLMQTRRPWNFVNKILEKKEKEMKTTKVFVLWLVSHTHVVDLEPMTHPLLYSCKKKKGHLNVALAYE